MIEKKIETKKVETKKEVLYKDYATLRKDIGKVQKTGKNPHFKNTFVELNTAIDVVDSHIEKHSFVCFLQTPTIENGKNILKTSLIHKNGETIDCELELITTRQDPQMLGSSLTYARRYSLLTILGLGATDDDGNLGSGVKTQPKVIKPAPKKIEVLDPQTKNEMECCKGVPALTTYCENKKKEVSHGQYLAMLKYFLILKKKMEA